MEVERPNLPLAGIRVLDLTIWYQGPIGTMLLADLGAEVIKLEKPVMGDFTRGARRLWGADFILPEGKSLMWEALNRNKKSVTLDLRHPKGKEALHRIIEKCDVFASNMNARTLSKFGADRETLLTHKPDLIYGHGTAFGGKGPDAEAPGQDTAGMARSGIMMCSVPPDGEPFYTLGAISDILSGTMLAFGIITALLGRERLGVSAGVSASQLGSLLWVQQMTIGLYATLGRELAPYDRKKPSSPLLNVYKCQDGQWLALGLYVTDRWWHSFCEVMGIQELEQDPKFHTEIERIQHSEELTQILDKIFLKRPREQWMNLFKERGFWFSIVNRIPDLPKDPQVIANEYIVDFPGNLKLINRPFELSETQIPRQRAPELGADTFQVLTEIGEYTPEEVATLAAEGVI